jgi:hypothetical protein
VYASKRCETLFEVYIFSNELTIRHAASRVLHTFPSPNAIELQSGKLPEFIIFLIGCLQFSISDDSFDELVHQIQ